MTKKEELRKEYLIGIILLLLILLLLLSAVLFVQNKYVENVGFGTQEPDSHVQTLGEFEKYNYEQISLEDFSDELGREVVSLLDLESYLRENDFTNFTRAKGFVQASKEETCYEEGKLVGDNDCELLILRFDQQVGIFIQILEVERP